MTVNDDISGFEAFINEVGPNPDEIKIKHKFIVVEGIDGSGKTSFINRFLMWNESKMPLSYLEDIWGGPMCLIFKDFYQNGVEYLQQPGFGITGEYIRPVIKKYAAGLSPTVKQLLFEANRIELLEFLEKDNTPLKDKVWALCDRHSDSTWVYQGLEGVEDQAIISVQDIYKNLPQPDFTIFLYADLEIARNRLHIRNTGGNLDYYDLKPIEFFRDCISRYKQRIVKNRHKYLVLNANLSENEIIDNLNNQLVNINVLY